MSSMGLAQADLPPPPRDFKCYFLGVEDVINCKTHYCFKNSFCVCVGGRKKKRNTTSSIATNCKTYPDSRKIKIGTIVCLGIEEIESLSRSGLASFFIAPEEAEMQAPGRGQGAGCWAGVWSR